MFVRQYSRYSSILPPPPSSFSSPSLSPSPSPLFFLLFPPLPYLFLLLTYRSFTLFMYFFCIFYLSDPWFLSSYIPCHNAIFNVFSVRKKERKFLILVRLFFAIKTGKGINVITLHSRVSTTFLDLSPLQRDKVEMW